MYPNGLFKIIATTLAVLCLTGCVPGSSGSVASTPISGKVADGYIGGATVFLDKNGNGVLDLAEDEPNVVTSASGDFTLSKTSQSDLASYRLIVIVPVTATDSDIGTVPNGFYLSYPKGGPNPPYVSPLSTLVDMRMQLTGVTLEEAFQDVTARLALEVPGNAPASDVLTVDLIKIAGIPTSDAYQFVTKLNWISRVLVNGMGKALDQARATMVVATNPAYEAELFKLVYANVLDSLGEVVVSASTMEPESATRTKVMVQADISARGTALAGSFIVPSLDSQNMIVAQVTESLDPVETSMSLNDLPDDDVYALRGRSGGQYDLARLYTSADSTGVIRLHSDDPLTQGTASSSTHLILTTTEADIAVWEASTALFGSPYIEGAVLKLAARGGEITIPAGPKFRFNVARYDIYNKTMEYILLKNAVTAANGFAAVQPNGNRTFPEGSEAYKLSFVVLEDIYVISEDAPKPGQASLDDFLNAYRTSGSAFFTARELNMKFAPGSGPGAPSGAVKFFDTSTTPVALPSDGLWEKETVRGMELLKLSSIEDIYKIDLMGLEPYNEPFIALADGVATGGSVLRKGVVIEFDGYLFNKTAINSISGIAQVP